MLGLFMSTVQPGARPFAPITSARATKELKKLLASIGVPNAADYRPHDLRRGHAEVCSTKQITQYAYESVSATAQDLRKNGANLYEILCAGDWRSSGFLAYMDKQELERDRFRNSAIPATTTTTCHHCCRIAEAWDLVSDEEGE